MVSPIFMITLVIGLGLIAIAFIQPEFIFNNAFTPLDISDLTELSIIDVPIDPTTGAILGTVKFGAPIIVPFERSGTVISADGTCETLVETITNPDGSRTFNYEVIFGRIGSGDRNSEVSWHGWNGKNCAFGYAEWDLTDLPNDFVATGLTLQLNLREQQIGNARCFIGFVSNTIDQIGVENLPNRSLWGNNFGGSVKLSNSLGVDGNDDFLVVGKFIDFNINKKYDTDWCESLGGKSWILGEIIEVSSNRFGIDIQAGVDAFNDAVSGGEFTQGTRSDKFTLLFYGGATGSGSYVIDHQWWEENGSLLVTGSSQPIRCDIGFSQVGFRCVPIICDVSETLNLVTNQCETIICASNEDLTIIDEPIGCIAVCIDDPSTPEIECGSSCPDSIQRAVCVPQETLVCTVELNCQEGTRPDSMNCGCELIMCPIGQELIGNNCQDIICPLNTMLIGNDCREIVCPTGQIAIDNVCTDPSTLEPLECERNNLGIQIDPNCIPSDGEFGGKGCVEGFKQVGDQCVPIDLDCPFGTEEFENTCVNRIPSLLQISGLDPTLFLIVGLVIVGMSGVGIVARRNA